MDAHRHLPLHAKIAIVMAVCVGMGVGVAEVARSWRSSGLGTIQVASSDRFYNYDFTGGTQNDPPSTWNWKTTDWPVNLIFENHASDELVKQKLGPRFDRIGSRMWNRLTDNGSTFWWFGDGGRKESLCPGAPGQPTSAVHYRLYADGGTDDPFSDGYAMFNLEWGYYVIGTSHIDYRECARSGIRWSGMSERAESRIAKYAQQRFDPDNLNPPRQRFLFNREKFRKEGKAGQIQHIWQSNGFATMINVLPPS